MASATVLVIVTVLLTGSTLALGLWEIRQCGLTAWAAGRRQDGTTQKAAAVTQAHMVDIRGVGGSAGGGSSGSVRWQPAARP